MLIRYRLLIACLVWALAAGAAHASTLYEIRQPDGSITFTYREPRQGERFRVVSRTRPRYSRLITARGYAPRPRPSQFDPLIHRCARTEGIDPSLVKAVVHAESSFDPGATSHKGAMGLMQLMPATARLLGVRDAYEPEENVCGGVRYLRMMLDRFGGDERLALAAYNAGPGAVERYASVPPYRETIDYIHKVRFLRERYQRQGGYGG